MDDPQGLVDKANQRLAQDQRRWWTRWTVVQYREIVKVVGWALLAGIAIGYWLH